MVTSHMHAPKPGDEVLVPWGLDFVPGVVLRTYDTGRGLQAVVRVDAPGVTESSEEEFSVTLPANSLENRSQRVPEPGEWVHAMGYERALFLHLKEVLKAVYPPKDLIFELDRADRDFDSIISLRSGPNETKVIFAVEIKYRNPRSRLALADIQAILARRTPFNVPILLISNVNLSDAAVRYLDEVRDQRFHWIRWNESKDDEILLDEIRSIDPS